MASMIPETGLFSNPSRSFPIQPLAASPSQATPAVNARPGNSAGAADMRSRKAPPGAFV